MKQLVTIGTALAPYSGRRGQRRRRPWELESRHSSSPLSARARPSSRFRRSAGRWWIWPPYRDQRNVVVWFSRGFTCPLLSHLYGRNQEQLRRAPERRNRGDPGGTEPS